MFTNRSTVPRTVSPLPTELRWQYFLTFSRDCYYAFFQKIRNFFIRAPASFAEASFFASQ